MNSFAKFWFPGLLILALVYILAAELQIGSAFRTTRSIIVTPLPTLPDPVRIMLEGFDLTMRGARTVSAAEIAAERAYGFVLGMDTVKALPSETIGNLYTWVDITYEEVINQL